MKLVLLTRGKSAKVDDADMEQLWRISWHAEESDTGVWYATRYKRLGIGDYTSQSMHGYLMKTPLGMHTHHINGDGLDNRRENLLIVTPVEHAKFATSYRHDKRLRSTNSSGYRGVHLFKLTSRWQAYIQDGKKRLHVGYFDNAEEAAHARDAKARELGWPESGMNFPL